MNIMSNANIQQATDHRSMALTQMPLAERYAARTFIGDMIILGARHLVRHLHSDHKAASRDVTTSGHYAH